MLKEVFKVEWKWYQIESESTQRNEDQWAIDVGKYRDFSYYWIFNLLFKEKQINNVF